MNFDYFASLLFIPLERQLCRLNIPQKSLLSQYKISFAHSSVLSYFAVSLFSRLMSFN